MTESQLRIIFAKTGGHCHFCGDPLIFEQRGWAVQPDGHWEVDHVVQRHKGGAHGIENYLPARTPCNRLRWHRTGEGVRELLQLGLVVVNEIKQGTKLGRVLEDKRKARERQNVSRRKPKGA